MGELDFGMAMLKSKSSVKEKLLLGETFKEGSSKPPLQGKKELGKRFYLIVGSLLKNHPGEKVLLPSDREIKTLRSGYLLLKR